MPTTFAERLADKTIEFRKSLDKKRNGNKKTPDSRLKTPKLEPLFMSSDKVTAPFVLPKPPKIILPAQAPKITIPPPPPINIIPSEQAVSEQVTAFQPQPKPISTLPSLTWLDKVKELQDDPEKLVPFVSSGVEIYTIGKLLKTALDLEAGREIRQEDLLALKEYVDRANQDTTWGYKVADVISQIVPFAGEFILTGGIYSVGKTATVKAGTVALKRIATKTGIKMLEGRLARYSVEAAGVLAGGTLRTLPAGVTAIPAATLEKQLVATLTGDEESVWRSARKALGERWVETVSEMTGGLFTPLTAPIKGKLVKLGIFKAFQRANPNKSAGDVKRIMESLGYHGVLNEMLEERVADVGHGILEKLGLGDQKFQLPSLQQLSVELAAFSVPGAAQMAATEISGRRIPPGYTIPAREIDITLGGERAGMPEEKPEAEVTPAPEVRKEPWQMTREEYRDFILIKYPFQWVNLKSTWLPGHKLNIEQALAEGKPVPSEVLADYPDLAKQAKVTAPVTPAPGVAGTIGRETVAYGPDPTKSYQMRYRLVELDDLIPSHTDAFSPNPAYPKELQPRIRERGTARLAVTKMAKDLVPEVLIKDDNTLDRGPMIIGNDNVVESGNGRVMALRQAQQSYPERWQAYQQALQEALPQFGVSQTELSQMRNPVLVRERISDVDRIQFASEANQPAVAVFSPLENALQDARRIRFDTLVIPEETQSLDITLRMTSNHPFVTSFLETIPANERASLLDNAGDLNLQGMQRIKAAMFAATYPGESGRRLTQIFFESREPIIRNIEEGMLASLPKVARAEELVRAGNRGIDLSIGEDLAKSLDMLAVLRQRKLSVAQYLAQRQMFERELTPFQERLLQHAETIARSPRKVREFLGDYADAVVASPHPQQATMIGGRKLTKEDIFNATVKRQEEGPLFVQPEGEIVAIPPIPTREPRLVAPPSAISEAEVVTPTRPVVPKAIQPPPQQEVQRLAEQVKAKLATEPSLVQPPTPKTPVERRAEIQSLLAEPAKNLPKGTTKIALRAELAQLNKSLIPQEKKLRQQIMAVAKSKSLSEKQYRDIFKTTGGSRQLSTIGLPQLEAVFKAVQRARPKKIVGKIVITPGTERAIQSLKAELIKQGKFSEEAYESMKKYLGLKTDRFETARRFITESEGKGLIRHINYEAEVGLLKRDGEVKAALAENPELSKVITKLSKHLNILETRASAKKVGVSPLWDMHLYMQRLQERTGRVFADVWEEAIKVVYRNDALLAQAETDLVAKGGDALGTILRDETALQRINDAIASKHIARGVPAVEAPTEITSEEQAIADFIEERLFGRQNKVRQVRFNTLYRDFNGDVDRIALEIHAPKSDIKEAVDIYEAEGLAAVNQYLDTKTWGVIESGFEPHLAVHPRLQFSKSYAAAVGKSHLRSREVETAVQEKNIIERWRSYEKQANNWDLEPYLRKIDQLYADSAARLKNPQRVKDILEQAMRELKGYHPTDVMTQAIQRAASYAFSTLSLAPGMTLRNSLQSIVMHPHREALLYLFTTRLPAEGKLFFDTFVNSQTAINTDLLLQEGLGNTPLERLVRKLTYYGWAETNINRAPGFLASYGKAKKALNHYQQSGNIARFIRESGLQEMPPLEQKRVLETMALDKVDFGVEGLRAVSGENAAIYDIARRFVQQSHFNYRRAERAPIEMGASGRTWGSLMTFPRNVGQRIYQDALRVKNGSVREKTQAVRRVLAIIVFAAFADWLLRKVTGKERSQYNPISIIGGWGIGGLASGVAETVSDVINSATEALTGEEGAVGRLIIALPKAGDMGILFYKSIMDLVEALSQTQYVDRKALREVRQALDDNYKLNPDYYRKERSLIGKIQHALFGGEPAEEPKKEAPPKRPSRFKKTAPTFKKKE